MWRRKLRGFVMRICRLTVWQRTLNPSEQSIEGSNPFRCRKSNKIIRKQKEQNNENTYDFTNFTANFIRQMLEYLSCPKKNVRQFFHTKIIRDCPRDGSCFFAIVAQLVEQRSRKPPARKGMWVRILPMALQGYGVMAAQETLTLLV